MIFGKTDEQNHEKNWRKHENKTRYLNRWVEWFAWRPIRLRDGRWAWFTKVEYTSSNRSCVRGVRHKYEIDKYNEIVFQLPE